MPLRGLDLGEEGIGTRDVLVHAGDVQKVHFRHCGLVNGGAADDEALFRSGGFRFPVCLLEGVDAGDAVNGVSAQVQDDVLPAGKGPADGKIGGAAHDYGAAQSGLLEVLEICGDVPWKGAFDAYFIVLPNGDNQTFFHTATGALMAGQGSYPSSVKSSYLKSNMLLTSGLICMVGSLRGSRESWSSTCSKWFL